MSGTRFFDSNVLLRLITFDHTTQSPRSAALFRQVAEAKFEALISMTVIFETVFVLEGIGYKHDRHLIAESIQFVSEAEGIYFIDDAQRHLPATLKLYLAHSQLSFADCYHAVLALEHCQGEIYSFDEEFRRVAGITRLEPGDSD